MTFLARRENCRKCIEEGAEAPQPATVDGLCQHHWWQELVMRGQQRKHRRGPQLKLTHTHDSPEFEAELDDMRREWETGT